jgi:hypothetical protein
MFLVEMKNEIMTMRAMGASFVFKEMKSIDHM